MSHGLFISVKIWGWYSMSSPIEILNLYPESFRVNFYSKKPFRAIGLIDVKIKYTYGTEKVTLAFYRSSGTNDGKIEGLWYPIVGIKTLTGSFTEFTEYLNYVLTNSTKRGRAKEGWLAKSLFFYDNDEKSYKIRGFSNGPHYEGLLMVGEFLRELYDKGLFQKIDSLDGENLNKIVTSKNIYDGNKHSQRENFEKLIADIYINI